MELQMETIFIGLIWNPLLWGDVTHNNLSIEDLADLREDRFIRPATLQDLITNPLIGCCVESDEEKEVRKRVRERVLELLEKGHTVTSSPSFDTIHQYYPNRYQEYLVDFSGGWDDFPLMRSKRTMLEWANFTQHEKMVRLVRQQFSINAPGRTDNSWMEIDSLVKSTFGSYSNLVTALDAAEEERLVKLKLEYFSVKEFLTLNF